MLAEKRSSDKYFDILGGDEHLDEPEFTHYAVGNYQEDQEEGSIEYWVEDDAEKVLNRDAEIQDVTRLEFNNEFDDFVLDLRWNYDEASVTDLIIVD